MTAMSFDINISVTHTPNAHESPEGDPQVEEALHFYDGAPGIFFLLHCDPGPRNQHLTLNISLGV
jgi:hypothetical protein